jgi:hypothetical protein
MGKAKYCADFPSPAQPGFSGLGYFLQPEQPAKHLAFSPPMRGAVAVDGAVLWGCPPGKLPSPELVRHVLRLPPGTHGFAGGSVPSQAGPAGQTYLCALLRWAVSSS